MVVDERTPRNSLGRLNGYPMATLSSVPEVQPDDPPA
jgi:hypothetical protein